MFEFTFPRIFMEWLINTGFINESQKYTLECMWEDLLHAFWNDKSVSTDIYMNMFDNDTKFNVILEKLCKKGFIESKVFNNFAELRMLATNMNLSDEQINNYKYQYKFNYYMLTAVHTNITNITKIGNKYKNTGLIRLGFAKASNYRFKYDTRFIVKYANYIAHNIYRDLAVSTKDVTYDEIVKALVEYYSIPDLEYTLNEAIHDSRGRAIFKCTSKVGNPISSKDMRACILIKPYKISKIGLRNVFAYISELMGYRGKNIKDKVLHGIALYKNKELPSLDEMIENDDYSDLHARIWLERIYDNLDHITEGWTVPIECDATASQLQITAVLLNDHDYMNLTNLINPEHFDDAWTINGVPRNHVKKAVTPRLYGSSAEPAQLWDKHKYAYTQEQVNIITNEIRNGRYKRADKFKDFIIKNVKPSAKMKVKIWNEEFWIECTRFKTEEFIKEEHLVYTSAQGIYRKYVHTVERVTDLEAFKRYFQTLLIHNLDSQVADYISNSDELSFIIPNHDAFIVTPDDVEIVRKLYTSKLMEMYKNRKAIITNYLKSIGITKEIVFRDDEEIKEFSGFCLK